MLSISEIQARWSERSEVMICHDLNIKTHNMQHDNVHNMVSKREYAQIVTQLENRGVFYPKKIVKDYTPVKVKEAIERTKYNKSVINQGAYFKAVLKQLS